MSFNHGAYTCRCERLKGAKQSPVKRKNPPISVHHLRGDCFGRTITALAMTYSKMNLRCQKQRRFFIKGTPWFPPRSLYFSLKLALLDVPSVKLTISCQQVLGCLYVCQLYTNCIAVESYRNMEFPLVSVSMVSSVKPTKLAQLSCLALIDVTAAVLVISMPPSPCNFHFTGTVEPFLTVFSMLLSTG